MKLSNDFYLIEFLRSDMAVRHDIEMVPSDLVVCHLRALVLGIMQPLRSSFDRVIIISSGYRNEEVNRLVGGSQNPPSAHMTGRACDFVINGLGPAQIIERLKTLPAWEHTDKAIDEYGQWTHVQIAKNGREPRKQHLNARRVDGKTEYTFV